MNQDPPDMRPYGHDTVMRQSQDPRILRLRMALHAKEHGVKAAARAFHGTPKTVRKWLARFDGTIASLQEHSRAPRRRPRQLSQARQEKILAAKKLCRRFSPKRLKLEFELLWSVKAIRRIGKEHGLNRRWRHTKTQTQRRLREVKKEWNLFQQIDIDTKNLCDIPEYGLRLRGLGLPPSQYTARDVSTGLLFLGYSDELSLSEATILAERMIRHLQVCGHDLNGVTWPSDNGSEFMGSWQAQHDSALTPVIQRIPGQVHRTLPSGQHRFQADVETFHNLMEQVVYEIESFTGRGDFIARANPYQGFFNIARRNSGKENSTPWPLVQLKQPSATPRLPLLSVEFLDGLHDSRLHSAAPAGYDVWALP